MVGNKIADKITSFPKKKSTKELPNDETEDTEITTNKKKYISPEERQQIISELRLIPKKRCIFLEIIDELMSTLKRCIYLSSKLLIN